MDGESQRAVAVWVVFVVPFVVGGGLLYARGQLTLGTVGLYWFPAVVLAILGVVPPPWRPIAD